MVSVELPGPPRVMPNTYSKTLNASNALMINATTITGRNIGNVIEENGGTAADVANTTNHTQAVDYLENMRGVLDGHASYTLETAITAADSSNVSAVEDIIDDFLGGSHSEAMDVIVEAYENGATPDGSASADLAADINAFADAQDANTESVEKSPQLNTTASLGVAMSAGDGWTAATSGSLNLGGGSVSGGTVSMSNGTMTISVGKHSRLKSELSLFKLNLFSDLSSKFN